MYDSRSFQMRFMAYLIAVHVFWSIGCSWIVQSICKIKTWLIGFPRESLETFISITNEGIFTKKISRVIEPIWNLWWKFHQNSFVSYEDKNFQTFSLKSWTRSFEGWEIRNFINLALYCPWIILFYKGCYQTLSQKWKMQNSLFAISMKKFGNFYLHN